ncbi:MAG: AcrR family transcriptional regulator [Paracoccaceae bacterium]|jgi:AcrR family transcriptional regulator
MADPKTPVLHRDDPNRDPLVGNIKVTRDDWLALAMEVLISDGVERVKVLGLAERLGVSRSSFYWYFKSRQDLLDALLARWQSTNTAAIVRQSELPADTITGAVCNVHRCVANPGLFDTALDFAVRDWARRSGKVAQILDQSDATRIEALTAMFVRYDYAPIEALTRARVLYYMQLGYDLAQLNETMEQRLAMVAQYLFVFTGQQPQTQEINDFADYARANWVGPVSGPISGDPT